MYRIRYPATRTNRGVPCIACDSERQDAILGARRLHRGAVRRGIDSPPRLFHAVSVVYEAHLQTARYSDGIPAPCRALISCRSRRDGGLTFAGQSLRPRAMLSTPGRRPLLVTIRGPVHRLSPGPGRIFPGLSPTCGGVRSSVSTGPGLYLPPCSQQVGEMVLAGRPRPIRPRTMLSLARMTSTGGPSVSRG